MRPPCTAANVAATHCLGQPARLGCWISLLLSASLACAVVPPEPPPVDTAPPVHEDDAPAEDNSVWARRKLEDARRLRDEGRLEAAARVCVRGLHLEPDDPALHRLCAELLQELGREQEASFHRERADALAPPPPLAPDAPLDLDSPRLRVVLFTGPLAPEDPVVEFLVGRIAVRLPEAELHLAPAGSKLAEASVAGAQRWLADGDPHAVLTLEPARARCGESIKDGRFSLARLLAASAATSGPAPARVLLTDTRTNLPADALCREHAASRAFEAALEHPEIRAILTGAGARAGTNVEWNREAIRTLFPQMELRIAAEFEEGRRQAGLGQLVAATAHFRRALAIDPEDGSARALLQETELSLALSRQLSAAQAASAVDAAPPTEEDGDLAPRFSGDQLRAVERQLQQEQSRRARLLAALEVVETDTEPPSRDTIAAMQAVEAGQTRGADLARARAHPVLVRVLYAPDGAPLARYYFDAARSEPDGDSLVLREEDSRRDGLPDRWVVFESGVRREVWEAGSPGVPELHMVYDEAGDALRRVELYEAGSVRPERVFHYREGRLASESRDSNSDGRFDLLEYFDPGGGLRLREEDLDHDGAFDVRTHYREGRVIRRDVVDPAFDDDRAAAGPGPATRASRTPR